MKKGVKKILLSFAIGLVVLMISGVFAETVGLSDNVKEIVKDIAEKKGVVEDGIENVAEVDFNDLPPQIDIENIDETNLAVYEVSQTDGKSFFVITVSDEKIKQYTKAAETYSRMFLNFGSEAIRDSSEFLETAGGVRSNLEKGYVMVRGGSITALSTNLEIVSGSGEIEFVIYKNGKAVGFRNNFVVKSAGVSKDYDSQSFGIVNFEAGNVISVYTKAIGDISWKDVITLVEITTE